jgi:hypothetical protein
MYVDTVKQFKTEAIERFTNQESFAYYGELEAPPWGQLGFVSQHRDSDALDRSNFQVITEDLQSRFPDAFTIEGSSHWLVGWVDVVRIDTSNDAAVVAAMDWAYQLEQYPVADDEHHSNLEHEEDQEYYDAGGRDDLVKMLEDYEELQFIFAAEDHPEYEYLTGDVLPEYEDALNDCFHRAMSYGDHTAIPKDGVDDELWVFDQRREELIVEARREYEKHQPAIEGMEI